MKRCLLPLIIICLAQTLCAQAPLVKMWDKRFGGTGSEGLTSLQQTSDGGYILGGYSYSPVSGDKTQPSWDGREDYWIVKIDSNGNKQWDKRFGGLGNDLLFSLQQTKEGGYILGGYADSGNDGDKSQPSWGNNDYWIVKIDSIGNKQWDRRYGGTAQDMLSALQQTADGGYILGGYSSSVSSGDKTQDNWGATLQSTVPFMKDDYWVVKVDSLGNKQWDKRYGGTEQDHLTSLRQTLDGGYILGGWTYSDNDGDVSQPSRGYHDYWIVKTDSIGNIQWEKRFGGSESDWLYSLLLTDDGGYIIAGSSNSEISGDKAQDNWNTFPYPTADFWILKLDSLGNKQWERDFGGTNGEDDIGNISRTSDGGYLVAGTSYSSISGDKSQNNLGKEQTWVIKIDSLGIKEWDKTMLTNTHFSDDEIGFAFQVNESSYVIANYTIADTGGYKTQHTRGGSDYWIIKFRDTTVCHLSIIGSDTANISLPATYSVIGGSSNYTWRVSNGIIISGQGTETIQIDWNVGRNGTVQVTVPGCGTFSKYITLVGYKRRVGNIRKQFPPIHLPGQH